MVHLPLFTLLAAALVAQTPAPKTTPKAGPAGAAKSAPKAAAEVIPLPSEPGQYAIFNTSMGRIIVKLFDKEAPITVANFTGLARGIKPFRDEKTGQTVKRPFYNGLTFHRVIPGFMIQGGDPLGNGTGGSGIPTIPDEFDPSLKFDQVGRLAMANTGSPHTGSVQFFITDGLPTYLNGKHTIFGQVVEGQDVVHAITAVPRNSQDKPDTPVVIKSLLIRRVGPAPVTAPKTGAAPKAVHPIVKKPA